MKYFSKKIVALFLMTVLTFSLASCGGSKTKNQSGDATTESKSIVVIAKGFQHQFWKAVEQGTIKAGEEFGVNVTFQGPDNESAIAQQVEYLNAAIDSKPTAICLAALDTKASLDSITNAMNNNIPIIGFDSGVPDAPEGAIKANASTDNENAGALAAENLYEAIKDKVTNPSEVVRIGVVAQEANSMSIISRTGGFIDKMVDLIGKDKVSVEGHDKFKNKVDGAKVIIDVGIPAEVKDADAAAVASALLEKTDLIAIYGSNEFTANAIITANEGVNKIGADKILAVGFDAGSKQLEAIRSGLFLGSVTQDPVQIGYQAVKLAVEASEGKTVSDVDTGALWYDSSNMEDDNIKPCLYE